MGLLLQARHVSQHEKNYMGIFGIQITEDETRAVRLSPLLLVGLVLPLSRFVGKCSLDSPGSGFYTARRRELAKLSMSWLRFSLFLAPSNVNVKLFFLSFRCLFLLHRACKYFCIPYSVTFRYSNIVTQAYKW